MKKFQIPFKTNKTILALGGDSSGNFSIVNDNEILYYSDFGPLFDEVNYKNYSNSIYTFLEKNKLIPDVILVDLHPLFKSRELGLELSEKFKADLIEVQHHYAHIFSAFGENLITNNIPPHFEGGGRGCLLNKKFIGIASDGTGFGLDEKIWGGEIFDVDFEKKTIDRIARLENQTLIGGEKAILEPARMLISILSKFLKKQEVYAFVKEYYSENEFELLYNQLKNNFNCIETSSTGRILDAVSIFLGFVENISKEKHAPIKALIENTGNSFEIDADIEFNEKENLKIIETTKLFEYLVKNYDQDRNDLAATAQVYLAKAFLECVINRKEELFFGGGMAHNKIFEKYLKLRGVITNNELKRGDDSLSFGQIFYYYFFVDKTVS